MKAAVEAGADIIVSGAGLPMDLPKKPPAPPGRRGERENPLWRLLSPRRRQPGDPAVLG